MDEPELATLARAALDDVLAISKDNIVGYSITIYHNLGATMISHGPPLDRAHRMEMLAKYLGDNAP